MKILRNLPILAYLARKLFGRSRNRKAASGRLAKVGKLPNIERAEATARATYPEYTSWAERVQAQAEAEAAE